MHWYRHHNRPSFQGMESTRLFCKSWSICFIDAMTECLQLVGPTAVRISLEIKELTECIQIGGHLKTLRWLKKDQAILRMPSKQAWASKPVAPIYIGTDAIEWVKKSCLLGITVDDKLSWVPHMLDLKKTFAKKLDLIRQSRFLPKDVLINFYFKVIFPSVTYGLVLWGSCFNAEKENPFNGHF